jgi:hypothetical protein
MDTDRLSDLLRSLGSQATDVDRLARSLTAARSRREIAATLLAGSLALLGLADSDAKRRRRKGRKGKGKGKDKKDDPCPAERVCGEDCCTAGETCLGGTTCCPTARTCAEACCGEDQICQDGTICCTEDVEAFCESQGVSCGTIFGPCGRIINCGTCPPGSICPDGACCRDLGQSCGPGAGGAPCCSGICGPSDVTGNHTCRMVGCKPPGHPCSSGNSAECCQGYCVFSDLSYRCRGFGE